jgi:hypothetical protein
LAGDTRSRNLYDHGWRQGSILRSALEVSVLGDESASLRSVTKTYDRWVVASQDCDLASSKISASEPNIELRPVFTGKPNADWGIRSRIFRLASDAYVEASSPRLQVSPKVLSTLEDFREESIGEGRAQGFKTWLGLRYDRPAVPPQHVDLAVAIATAIHRTRSAELSEVTHDVLMQFSDDTPPRYILVGVITDETNPLSIVEWLAAAALQVDSTVGLLAEAPAAVTKRDLSLQFLEDSYGADLSAITWAKEEPSGAT